MLWGRPGVGLWAARPLVREPSLVLVWTSGGPFVAVVAASLVCNVALLQGAKRIFQELKI